MPYSILPASGYRVMRWKNGGGSTTEIAVSPGGADMTAFDWRISMALIERNGPFSMFEGVDRTLCVLDGEGFVLGGLGLEPTRLTRSSRPCRFSADVPVDCALLGSAVTDLNVMTRRGRFHHDVRSVEAGEVAVAAGSDTVFVVARQPATLRFEEGVTVALAIGDAARLDAGTSVRLDGQAQAYLVRLWPNGM